MTIIDRPEDSLAVHGLRVGGRVLRNPTTSQLYAAAIDRGEGVIAEDGPLVVDTGRFTGRSPKDKFIVREPGSEDRIWWSDVNAEISEEHFDGLRGKVSAHLEKSDVYVIDAYCGADPKHRLSVRIITAHPYHALFARTMFIDPTAAEAAAFRPDAVVLHAPDVQADPAEDLSSVCAAVGAQAVVRGADGQRVVSMEDFHRGPYETAVGDAEMLVEIRVPLRAGAGSAYEKVERRVGDWAVAASGAALRLEGGTIAEAGIALTAVGGGVTCERAEASLVNQMPIEDAFAAAADLAAEECSPTADQRGSAEYKRHLARELTLRALRSAAARALREREY